MKKLWVNTVPGRDKNADLIFHFHQEMPKFLRGWHHLDIKQTALLAALLYRTRSVSGALQ
jgi:myosin-7